MKVLGIESSCDETAAAIVEDGTRILSSVVASQIKVHQPFGGVVPELASRKHLEAIIPVVTSSLADAGLDMREIDAVAATQGPGLVGALLVGFSFAKAFAFGLKVPFIGINHLEGHIQTVFLADSPPTFPFVALLASGGHTAIYYVTNHDAIRLLGQTRDDAAGEAYDKVSKMLGLGYPGGQAIESAAAGCTSDPIRFPKPFLDKADFDFSFSGLKTAVLRYIETHPNALPAEIPQIAAGFQHSAITVLSHKLLSAAKSHACQHLAVVGGVAANRMLRETVTGKATAMGLTVHIPPPALCGDNAAMIAAAGYHRLKAGRVSGLSMDVFSKAPS
jgi:N6-L-threonylcarbamoyladenine synthase